jgi:tRNA dimethylallyltransferase
MYLKVLLRGLFDGPPADETVRRELEQAAVAQGDPALHRRLAQVDPAAAARIAPADRRRVIRALEVHALTGRPLSDWQTQHDQPAREVRVAALARPRPALHARIDARVEQMFRDGLVAEVEALGALPRPLSRTARQAVGYAEVIAYLAGDVALGPTVARIQARTRQFARRQETWFRGLAEVRSWPVGPDEPPARTAAELAAWLAAAP